MHYTRKQVVTGLSSVVLSIATALALYASFRTKEYTVPISDALTGFTTVLPFISGILVRCGYDLTARQEHRQGLSRGQIQRPPLVIIASTIIFVYASIIITLAGTHATKSPGLTCVLRDTWQTLFRHKDDGAIRRIQDAFDCCGFSNSRDMAFPFPDRTHNEHACEIAYHRNSGCIGPWGAEERSIAGLLIAVASVVAVWQLAIILIPTQRESWLHSIAPDRVSRMIADERHGGDQGPSRISEYADSEAAHHADRIREHGGYNDNISPERAIEEGNRRINNALPANLMQEEPIAEIDTARM